MGEMRRMSLDPATFTRGGLLDNADVTFVRCEYAIWDYGQPAKGLRVPAAHIVMRDSEGDEHEQWYSCGSKDDYIPSDDGKALLSETRSALNENCNLAVLLASIRGAGISSEDLIAMECDITNLVGFAAHMVQQPAPRRRGLEGQRENATVLVVDHILPESAIGGTGEKRAAAEDSPSSDEDVEDLAVATVVDLLSAAPNHTLLRKQLTAKVPNALADHPKKTEVARYAYSNKFLSDPDRPWDWDEKKKSVTLLS